MKRTLLHTKVSVVTYAELVGPFLTSTPLLEAFFGPLRKAMFKFPEVANMFKRGSNDFFDCYTPDQVRTAIMQCVNEFSGTDTMYVALLASLASEVEEEPGRVSETMRNTLIVFGDMWNARPTSGYVP
jgi:hypothetical protein